MAKRTRIVRWLRVILPLAALAMLSMLFLLAGKPDPEGSIPYAEGQLEELARESGISAPTYSTVTEDGTTVTLHAARATAGGEGGAASDLSLDWQTRDGVTAHLNAATATQNGATIALSGDVDMSLSSGWRLTTPSVDADTQATVLSASGPVAVTAPFGQVEAGAMQLSDTEGQGQVLELNRGVRLIYRP